MLRILMTTVLVLPALASAQRGERDLRVLRATDLEASLRHYDALGFDVARRSADELRFRRRGGTTLVLTTRAAPEVEADPLQRERALVVPIGGGIAALRAELAERGLPFEVLVARPSKVESILATDPDGHRTILRPRRDCGDEVVAIPGPGELNPIVLELIARYPADGTHRYHWPKSGAWKGNTKDLEYAGELLEPGDPEGRCYCCGLTFEVLLDAWRIWCARHGRAWRIGELDLDGVRRLHRQWFGSASDPSCLHTGFVANGLGHRIEDLDAARPGDFVQLWRANGSGHSVVFLGWERDGERITAIRYWSTQPGTKGIGERSEPVTEDAGERRVLLGERFWLCRAGAAPEGE